MPMVMERIKQVRQTRLSSVDPGARKLADRPSQFRDTFNPKAFIAIPEVSSERRKYIPVAYFSEETIASNTTQIVPNASEYHFGVLTSIMHMSWVKYTCGRLKSDFRYSNSIVYNNYPWPKAASQKNKDRVELKAQQVLDVRAEFPDSSLADLYDPLTMPSKLVKAHQELDKAVDLCYRSQAFATEAARIEFLFELYQEYTAPLLKVAKKKKHKPSG